MTTDRSVSHAIKRSTMAGKRHNVNPYEARIAKLEAQIHFLVECVSEKQLDEFVDFCLAQN